MTRPIYRPAVGEYTPHLEHARRKWPHLSSRIDKAAAILSANAINHDGASWIVRSQADGDHHYTVDRTGCSCPDFIRGAAVAEYRPFCKHLIAFLTYREVLIDWANGLCIGLSESANFRRLKRGEPVLVQSKDALFGLPYDAEEGIFHWQFNATRGRRDIVPADLIKFARWLHLAMPDIIEHRQMQAEIAAQMSAMRLEDQYADIGPDDWPPSGRLDPKLAAVFHNDY